MSRFFFLLVCHLSTGNNNFQFIIINIFSFNHFFFFKNMQCGWQWFQRHYTNQIYIHTSSINLYPSRFASTYSIVYTIEFQVSITSRILYLKFQKSDTIYTSIAIQYILQVPKSDTIYITSSIALGLL
jgi:hypothetical protein